MEGLLTLWHDTGLYNFQVGQLIMMFIGGYYCT